MRSKDFSERRRELWPIIDSYEVNEVTKDFADVTEGTVSRYVAEDNR